jgi:hypothetical protein
MVIIMVLEMLACVFYLFFVLLECLVEIWVCTCRGQLDSMD